MVYAVLDAGLAKSIQSILSDVPQHLIDECVAESAALHAEMRAGKLSQGEFDQRAEFHVRKQARLWQEHRPSGQDTVEAMRAQFAALHAHKEPDEIWRFDLHCAECGRAPEKLSRCSRCKVVKYCSAECQRKAWDVHKASCGSPLPTAPRVREATVEQLLAMLREFGSSEQP